MNLIMIIMMTNHKIGTGPRHPLSSHNVPTIRVWDSVPEYSGCNVAREVIHDFQHAPTFVQLRNNLVNLGLQKPSLVLSLLASVEEAGDHAY